MILPPRFGISLPVPLTRSLSAIGLVLALFVTGAQGAYPGWVDTSNAITRQVLGALGRFQPEFASQQGLPEFDGLTQDLGPRRVDRRIEALKRVLADLRRRLAVEPDARVQLDLRILIDEIGMEIEGERLRAAHLLAWTDVPEAIFLGLNGLLDEQVPAERRAKALQMLQRYVGLHPGTRPLTQLARDRFEESRRPGRTGPLSVQVEQSIAKSPDYARGIRELFARWRIDGAEPALTVMEAQFVEYAAWQRRAVLPLARTETRLPAALYAFRLREVGIDIEPMELVRQAQLAYLETRTAMEALAPQVAGMKGITATDYRDVIRELKRETISDDRLVDHYAAINRELEAVIRRERIVSLPERPMGMRLASPAESAALPAPHMVPPPLVDNTGQRGLFVLPVSDPDAKPEDRIDDFNFPAATWTLSAHEGRPGHELQFAAMVERGVSVARALFAFNSVNVEGWALYAEAQTLPYEPVDGQLIALQMRLLRAARAMLDPMVNLGLIGVDDAARVLREEVRLSAPMVRQEIDRYTFRDPGQAGAYFYGYLRLLQLRTETELALGSRFDRLAFNDFLLDQGLLPPQALARVVREEFVPARRRLPADAAQTTPR